MLGNARGSVQLWAKNCDHYLGQHLAVDARDKNRSDRAALGIFKKGDHKGRIEEVFTFVTQAPRCSQGGAAHGEADGHGVDCRPVSKTHGSNPEHPWQIGD